jgi:hypothetical protein
MSITNSRHFITVFNRLKPSGYYMYHQFNIQKSGVLPAQFIHVFGMVPRTVIIILYNINWLFFLPRRNVLSVLY